MVSFRTSPCRWFLLEVKQLNDNYFLFDYEIVKDSWCYTLVIQWFMAFYFRFVSIYFFDLVTKLWSLSMFQGTIFYFKTFHCAYNKNALCFWHLLFLKDIGNTLKNYIKFDLKAIKLSLFTYVRICVEIDIGQNLLDKMFLQWRNFRWIQALDYENNVFWCWPTT